MAWGNLCSPAVRTPNSSEWLGGCSFPQPSPETELFTHTPLPPIHPKSLGTHRPQPQYGLALAPVGAGLLPFRPKATGWEGNEGGRGPETLTWLEGCLEGKKHRKAQPSATGKARKAILTSLRTQGQGPLLDHPALACSQEPGGSVLIV